MVTQKDKEKVDAIMNFPGSNYKDINFWKELPSEPGFKTIEIGYWITYTGCKRKYNKEVLTITL